MAFLMISKSYSNILMEQLFLCFSTELFVLITASAVSPTRPALYLTDLELLILKLSLLAGTSSLLNCYKLPDVFESLSLYPIKLYAGIAI